jgi:hypothetical protein
MHLCRGNDLSDTLAFPFPDLLSEFLDLGVNLTAFAPGFRFGDSGEGFVDVVSGVAEEGALVRGAG